jgi:ADP-dependent phosphofructokinase/glucokinase
MEETMPSSEALSGLSSPDNVVRLQTLSRIGPILHDQAHIGIPLPLTTMTEIARLIHDPVPEIRREAMWVLARADGSRVNNELTTLAGNLWTETRSVVDDSSPHIADLVTCIQALGYLNKQSQNDPILAQCSLHPDASVRSAAYSALAYTYAVPEEAEEFGAVTAIRQFARNIGNVILYPSRDPDIAEEQTLLAKANGNPETKSIIADIRRQAWNERTVDPAFVRRVLDLQAIEKEKPHYDISKTEYNVVSDLALIFDPGELQEMIDAFQIQSPCDLPRHFKFNVIRKINGRFREALNPEPTEIPVLCGLTSNIDRMCFLNNEQPNAAQNISNNAIEEAITDGVTIRKNNKEYEGKSEEQMKEDVRMSIRKYMNDEDRKDASTKEEIVGAILQSITSDKGESRLKLKTKELAFWVEKLFAPYGLIRDKIGGASAAMAKNLRATGEPNVFFFSPYHSQETADAFDADVPFFQADETKHITVKEAANPDAPQKINYPIEIQAGLTISLDKLSDTPEKPAITKNANRLILLTEYYDKNGTPRTFEPLFPKDILDAACKRMKAVIVHGVHYLQNYPEKDYKTLSAQMYEQMATLQKHHVRTHYEFSGRTGVQDIRYLTDVMQDTLYSMGINDGELPKLAVSIRKITHEDPSYSEDDPIEYQLYQDALCVATYLSLDRLYMHGEYFDITIRKNGDDMGLSTRVFTKSEREMNDILEREQRASFIAKQRVREWLQAIPLRPITPKKDLPTRFLRQRGYDAMVRLLFRLTPRELDMDELTHMRRFKQIAEQGYIYLPLERYSCVITPNKWIYDQDLIKQTTSAGDTTSSVNFIHSL